MGAALNAAYDILEALIGVSKALIPNPIILGANSYLDVEYLETNPVEKVEEAVLDLIPVYSTINAINDINEQEMINGEFRCYKSE